MIFDTDVMIWAFRGNAKALDAIDSADTRSISSVTYMELLRGVRNKKELQEIKLKPEVVDPDDIEMLEDLILVAVNDAMKKVDDENQSQMSKLTGGMNIPGLF